MFRAQGLCGISLKPSSEAARSQDVFLQHFTRTGRAPACVCLHAEGITDLGVAALSKLAE